MAKFKLVIRRSAHTIAAAISLLMCISSPADSVHFNPVPLQLIEYRLGKYVGNNKQREANLKQLFTEAGCNDQHLSEQSVKGSKFPNVICVLPGNSDEEIIVGAHFDRVSESDGVVDNWSGASLLPSLYEAVKIAPRTHTYIRWVHR